MNRPTQHRLTVNQCRLDFELVRSRHRQRTIALQLKPDGRMMVRAPEKSPLSRIISLVSEKASWVQKRRYQTISSLPHPSPPKEFVEGESFYFLGQQYRLKAETKSKECRVLLDGVYLRVLTTKSRFTPSAIKQSISHWFEQQAKLFLVKRVDRWLRKLGITRPCEVLISDQSRRWASCSSTSKLRFNWRLMGAPVSLVDYVIAHELCHLLWPNHSALFWKELRRIMPDFSERERQLIEKGPALIL